MTTLYYHVFTRNINITLFFEILIKEFDTLFEHIFQEGEKLKLLNTNIIQSDNDISFEQKDHIIKNIIQEYWVTNTK